MGLTATSCVSTAHQALHIVVVPFKQLPSKKDFAMIYQTRTSCYCSSYDNQKASWVTTSMKQWTHDTSRTLTYAEAMSGQDLTTSVSQHLTPWTLTTQQRHLTLALLTQQASRKMHSTHSSLHGQTSQWSTLCQWTGTAGPPEKVSMQTYTLTSQKQSCS